MTAIQIQSQPILTKKKYHVHTTMDFKYLDDINSPLKALESTFLK